MKLKDEELKQKYTDKIFLENFKNLFSLRSFFYYSIIKADYTVPNLIDKEIVLTEAGTAIFNKLKSDKLKDTENHLIKFALLMEFYHDELFIDVLKTNIEALEALLHRQILDNIIFFPWIYGRLLYDKYYDSFEEQVNILKNEDVIKLLEKTPKGVFQIGKYIVGPLGLLKSNNSRFFAPQKNLRLWHCSDPSCGAFHKVYLASGKNIITELISKIHNLLQIEQSSDWGEFFLELIEEENYYFDSNRITETPYLVINALGNSEIKSLLKEIIDNEKDFRTLLPDEKRFKGSSDDIIKLIEKDVCFQLILLESDENTIKSVEKLIDQQVIFIPPTEIRKPMIIRHIGFYGIYHECNKLGIRSITRESNLGLRRLNSLLIKIYSEPSIQQQLDWKLRFFEKESLREKIEAYTLQEEPQKIIRDTVLSGALQISQTFKYLFGNFEIPNTMQEEELLIDKILWKLGFDINIYPTHLSKFWDRLQKFKDTTRSCVSFNDTDKERIRSAAVNFWISLEEILEQTLSFITWAILSDHFLNTQFKYNFEEARNFMCEKLNGYQIGSGEKLVFDNKGKNTLFPLTEGFSALNDICNKMLSEDVEKYKRTESEMPSFWHKAELVTFPFESRIYLFDIKPSNFKILSNIISEVPRNFGKNNVLSVRNRTQHKRDDFPSQNEILAACNAIEDVVNKIELNSVYPNVYLFKCTTIDKYGRVTFNYEDYKSRNITLRPTFEYRGCKIPPPRAPQIIIPIINIGNSHELLRFKYEETSSYLKYWKNFPRKKEKKIKKESESGGITISPCES